MIFFSRIRASLFAPVILASTVLIGVSCVSTPREDHPHSTQQPNDSDTSVSSPENSTESASNPPEQLDTETILANYSAGKQGLGKTLRELEEIKEKTPEEKLLYAIMLRSTKRFDESRRELEAVLAVNPKNALAMFNLALIEHVEGNKAARDQALNRTLEMGTQISEAFAFKGKIETERSNFSAAERNFQQALKIEPDSVESLVGLAWLKARKESLEEALLLLNRALELDDYAYAFSDRSRVNAILGNYNDAEDDINEAIRLEPEVSWHYLDRARIRLRHFKNLEAAKKDLERVEKLSPGNFFVQVYLAGIHDEQRNFERAEYYYGEALAQHDNYPWAYMPMGKFAWMRGDFAEAAGFFDRASEEDGKQDIFIRLMAALSRKQLGKDGREESRRQLSALLREYELGSAQYEVIRFCIEGRSDFFAVNALNKEKDETLRERLWFYMGWMYKLENNLAGARAVFERIASRQGFMEYDIAWAESERLNGKVAGAEN